MKETENLLNFASDRILFHLVIVKTNIFTSDTATITRGNKMQAYAKFNKYPLYIFTSEFWVGGVRRDVLVWVFLSKQLAVHKHYIIIFLH